MLNSDWLLPHPCLSQQDFLCRKVLQSSLNLFCLGFLIPNRFQDGTDAQQYLFCRLPHTEFTAHACITTRTGCGWELGKQEPLNWWAEESWGKYNILFHQENKARIHEDNLALWLVPCLFNICLTLSFPDLWAEVLSLCPDGLMTSKHGTWWSCSCQQDF